jgi:hypothetical protein
MGRIFMADRRRIHGVGLVLSWLLVAWLGWQIIANTTADTRARTDPLSALAWRGDSAAALVNLAGQRLAAAKTEEDLKAVADLAGRALAARPLEEPALALLALVADVQGQADRADSLMTLAGDRSLRDSGAQVWLFSQRMREKDFGRALRHADAVLRTRPDLHGQFLPCLTLIASDSAARPALVEVLGADPPWRARFLGELARGAPSAAVAYAVLSALEASPHPPRVGEFKPYLDQAIGTGQFELAFLAWLSFLRPDQSKALPYVYNGDFELPISGLPFDWTIAAIRGAVTETTDTGEEELGRALRVVFANTRVPYRHVSKLLVLPPGAYELTGLVKADALVNERGMRWRVFCAEEEQQSLGESESVVGTTGWRSFAAEFEIPASRCRAQWLRLELAARIPLEEQVSGAIWYDRLAIRRVSPSTANAAAAAN